MDKFRRLVLAFAALAVTCGCSLLHPKEPKQVGPGASGEFGKENPRFFPIADRELLWNQLVDELDDYFKIEREQRMQEVGGVVTEGRIQTFPVAAATYLEPWRRDSTPGYERLHATTQSLRRRAETRVIPRNGGYLVEVLVYKELEDVSQPEGATVRGEAVRHDTSLVRGEQYAAKGPTTLGWICLGRDLGLEQQILTELEARLEK